MHRRPPPAQVWMNRQTVDVIRDAADKQGGQVNLAKRFDIIVKRKGDLDKETENVKSSRKPEGSSYCSSDDCRDRRSSPTPLSSKKVYPIVKRRAQEPDPDEIHDLIQKIGKAVEVLDEKERVMEPFGSKPYRPLNIQQREGMDKLVLKGHKTLDQLEDIQKSPYSNKETQYMKEGELKSVLLALKSKLINRLPPSDRNNYDKIEKAQLQQRMSSVEDRILGIMNDLEDNDRQHAIAIAKQKQREREDRERRALEQEKLRRAAEEASQRKLV